MSFHQANKNIRVKLILAITILPVLILNTYALDFESAKEQTCLHINKTANVDTQWMMSAKEWYYPLMSRLDLYLTSLEIYGSTDNPENLSESQLYYDSCVKVKLVDDVPYLIGFNGKRTTQIWETPTVSDEGVTSQKFTDESGHTGVVYMTLTDNSTYIFSVVCLDDNQATWGVVSTIENLPEETKKVIHDHAESLGFKREYFEQLRYNFCGKERNNSENAEGSVLGQVMIGLRSIWDVFGVN